MATIYSDCKADEKVSDDSPTSSNALNEENASDISLRALDDDPVFSYNEQRKIIHRIDRRLVITCGIIYCFSLIDRGNLGNASIAGMTDSLKLNVGFRYGFGFAKKWTDMIGLRVGLGILEAGLYPSVVYLLATWYTRYFPEKADQSWKFLNKEERDFIVRRINKDRDDVIPEKFTITRFLRPALDIKLWILAFISL
ncbi:MAG: hypothetical protein Q9223_007076 [Gallowayella weberi]